MELFSVKFFLFFIISREAQCRETTNIAGVDISKISSYISPLLRGKTEDTKNASTTLATSTLIEGEQPKILSWKQKLQNTLISILPNFPESARLHILVALKALFSNIPGSGLVIAPIMDEVIAMYATSKDKDIIQSTDTTDAMILKLMSQKIDEKNLDEFLQIAADSRLVKDVTSGFANSLQQIGDKFIADYVEGMKSKSK